MKQYIGIDNGVSGTIGVVNSEGVLFFSKMPVRKEKGYQKSRKTTITRIDQKKLKSLLEKIPEPRVCYIERPMTNPSRMLAMFSSMRALEATLIALEAACIQYHYIDSKEWQKALLGEGLKGEELKSASREKGLELSRFLVSQINHDDADGLLIAEHARRFYGKEKETYTADETGDVSLFDK